MITIVAHFCTQVVKFIFGGRNSGQNAGRKTKERLGIPLKVTDERVNFRLARDPGVSGIDPHKPTSRSRSSLNAWFGDLASIQAHRSLEAVQGPIGGISGPEMHGTGGPPQLSQRISLSVTVTLRVSVPC
jgi:hypothetical protein